MGRRSLFFCCGSFLTPAIKLASNVAGACQATMHVLHNSLKPVKPAAKVVGVHNCQPVNC